MGGAYNLRVSIDGVDIVGSPTPVLMLAAKPDVSRFAVSGEGLQKAVAGKPAHGRKDSCLSRDIQAGRRLIKDHTCGLARECHGDAHPLSLTA
jgi:hypothetical protein